jgi:hypothetical protein
VSRRAAFALVMSALVAGMLVLGCWREERGAAHRLGFGTELVDGGLRVTNVIAGSPAATAGLRQDDVIVDLQGAPIRSNDQYDRTAETLGRGEQVRLGLVRAGQRLTLTAVAGLPFPWVNWGFNALASVGYLGLALLALFQGVEDRRARLLSLFSAAVALELATPSSLPGAHLAWWATAVYVLMPLVIGLQAGLELQLASLIPEPRRWFLARPWLPRVYFAAGLLLYLPVTAVALGGLAGFDLPWSASQVRAAADDWGMVGWAIAIVVILLAQLGQCETPRHRHQVLLVLLGSAPWVIFSAALTVSTLTEQVLPDWATNVFQPIALLVYPIAIFVAIFRYHLFDIELVVKRGLVYSMVTVSLVVLLYVAIGIGNSLV